MGCSYLKGERSVGLQEGLCHRHHRSDDDDDSCVENTKNRRHAAPVKRLMSRVIYFVMLYEFNIVKT